MRKLKKPLIYVLCAVLLSCSILSVRPPQKAYAIAVVDDAAVLLAILIATGVVYVGSTLWRENLDGTVDIDFPWDIDDVLGNQWDDLQGEYWREHNEATGGSGDGSDFDPDQDDPNDKPPKWDKLKEYVKSHGGVAFAAGGALGTLAASFAKKVHDLITIEDALVSPIKVEDFPNLYIGYSTCGATNPTFLADYNNAILDDTFLVTGESFYSAGGRHYVAFSTKYSGYDSALITYSITSDGLRYQTLDSYNSQTGHSYPAVSANYIFDGIGYYNSFGKNSFLGDMNNYPFYISPCVGIYVRQAIFDGKTDYGPIQLLGTDTDFITADNTVASSDLSDYITNNPDASSLPVADRVRVPTEQELQDFYTKYKQNQQNAIDELIKKLTSTSTEPEPDNPGETGGGGTDKPSESEPGVESGELGDYTAPSMITQVFPFCIPFDLIRSVQILAAPGEAPRWELPLKVERLGIDYTFVIDMAEFEELAVIFRAFMTLLFILSLILVTRALIKG